MHRLWSWSSSFWQVTVIFQHSLQRCKQKSVLIKHEKIAESNTVSLWTECRAHETLKVRYWDISKRNQKEKEKKNPKEWSLTEHRQPVCVYTTRGDAHMRIRISSYTNVRGHAPQSTAKHFAEVSDLRIGWETLFKAHGPPASHSPGKPGNICTGVFRVSSIFESVWIWDQQHTSAGRRRGVGGAAISGPGPAGDALAHAVLRFAGDPTARAVLAPGGCQHPGTLPQGLTRCQVKTPGKVQAFIPSLF